MGFGNQFDSDFVQAIEIAVKTTGQSALLDFEAALNRTKVDIDALALALKNGVIPAAEFAARVTPLIAQQEHFQAAVDATTRVLNGQSAAMASTQGRAYGAQRAVLELSRAFEDFATGGFLGVVNNVPGAVGGIAQAAGLAAPAIAKLEGAAAILTTTAYLLYRNWDQVKKLFDDGLGAKVLDDIKDVENALKDLTAKEWKTRVDVQDIQIAKEQLEELRKAKAGYEGLAGQSEAEKKRGGIVTEAVVEGGGREAVTRAVIAAAAGPESEQVKATREKLASFEGRIKAAETGGNGQLVLSLMEDRERLLKSDDGKRAVADQNRRKAVEDQLGLAGKGDEIQRKWLEGLFNANQDKFQAAGVDVDRFGAGLANAAPDRLFDEERRKMAEKRRKEEEAAQREAATTRLRARDEMVKVMDDNQKAEARAKEGEAVWQVQQQQRLDREEAAAKAKSDREAAAERNRQINEQRRDMQQATRGPANWGMYAGQFQAATGANDAQATEAGKRVGAMVEKGTDPTAAMRQVYAAMLKHARETQMQMLRMQADAEQAAGEVGQATMMLRMIGQQQRRNQQQRRTLGRIN